MHNGTMFNTSKSLHRKVFVTRVTVAYILYWSMRQIDAGFLVQISGRRAKYHNCCFRQTTNSLLL